MKIIAFTKIKEISNLIIRQKLEYIHVHILTTSVQVGTKMPVLLLFVRFLVGVLLGFFSRRLFPVWLGMYLTHKTPHQQRSLSNRPVIFVPNPVTFPSHEIKTVNTLETLSAKALRPSASIYCWSKSYRCSCCTFLLGRMK